LVISRISPLSQLFDVGLFLWALALIVVKLHVFVGGSSRSPWFGLETCDVAHRNWLARHVAGKIVTVELLVFGSSLFLLSNLFAHSVVSLVSQ